MTDRRHEVAVRNYNFIVCDNQPTSSCEYITKVGLIHFIMSNITVIIEGKTMQNNQENSQSLLTTIPIKHP